jgi:hypothetical protein
MDRRFRLHHFARGNPPKGRIGNAGIVLEMGVDDHGLQTQRSRGLGRPLNAQPIVPENKTGGPLQMEVLEASVKEEARNVEVALEMIDPFHLYVQLSLGVQILALGFGSEGIRNSL